MGVSHDDVGSVLNCPDVSEVNGGTGSEMNWRIQQLIQLSAQRHIRGCDPHEIACPNRSSRQDNTAAVHRENSLFGGDVVRIQLVGIQPDDDCTLVAAECWRC